LLEKEEEKRTITDATVGTIARKAAVKDKRNGLLRNEIEPWGFRAVGGGGKLR